jgi:heat shock protein HtpX
MTPQTRAKLVVALFAAIPALVLGAIAFAVAGAIVGIVVLAAVAVILGAWARLAGDRRVLGAVGGHQADPVGDARLWNLAEGLSISAGLRQPRLLVIDSPGLNAVAAGTRADRAIVGVTSGLLAELDRIELEAVLAEELMQIRHHQTTPATVVAATFGFGRSLVRRADQDAYADQAAVALTRYPPALASALEKLEAKGAEVADQPAWVAHLWLADPRPGVASSRGRLPLRDRIEALREL